MRRRLRIGVVAPPWVPVPPPKYGGTEGVIDTLARGLSARGHHVLLFTLGESTCPVPRAWVYHHPALPMGSTVAEMYQVTRAYRVLADCDVVHDHTDAGPMWAAGRAGFPPVVATNHNAFTRERRALYSEAARLGVRVVAISHDQRSHAPEVLVDAVVHNGIDPARFPFGRGEGGYAMFVGRFGEDKGAHRAVEAARRAGVPLRIAAKMRERDEEEYFERWIRPALGPDVVFLGEISPEERNRELAGAVALLDPIEWDEPFGLVMVEALACGTPVIAFRRGAAPEIVRDGVTGRLVDDVEGAAEVLAAAHGFDRFACRADVERRFSGDSMVYGYESAYGRAIDALASSLTP